ncbi:MAG TPA: hypothetical protein EYN91_15930 [Candidatus Melainabacteria bacterium]|nr:hypothetical protein [Candidatus Melainabacteria bacterium]HIN63752.1 hypothetical protein [Candidatus Obscuribacterales bacterium]
MRPNFLLDVNQGNLKSVQIEELVAPDSPYFIHSDTIKCAYLHSIWNDSENRFIHLDGAVKEYSKQNYEKRYKTQMHRTDFKADSYMKVFRIDASLTVNEWADLVSKYFYHDELIVEYLSELLSDTRRTIAPRGAN